MATYVSHSMNQDDNGTITAYPLSWPRSWKRTHFQQRSRFGDRSLSRAREEVDRQVRLMGGRSLVISSNIELRLDGLPRSGQKQPSDRGVAVYFDFKRKPFAFACDKWSAVEDNLWAIGKHIENLRESERWGVGELEQAFMGYAQLAAPAGASWWDVLGVSQSAGEEEIRIAYRTLAKRHHPDLGGDRAEFDKIQTAYETAQIGRSSS